MQATVVVVSSDAAIAKVLRSFLLDGRLRSMPAAGKRRIVLEHLWRSGGWVDVL